MGVECLTNGRNSGGRGVWVVFEVLAVACGVDFRVSCCFWIVLDNY